MQRFYRFVTSVSSAGELGARHRSQICRGLEQRFARLPFHATAKNRMLRMTSDATAGFMVLSEGAKRLAMMSGASAVATRRNIAEVVSLAEVCPLEQKSPRRLPRA
jgi:hypothetical protein